MIEEPSVQRFVERAVKDLAHAYGMIFLVSICTERMVSGYAVAQLGVNECNVVIDIRARTVEGTFQSYEGKRLAIALQSEIPAWLDALKETSNVQMIGHMWKAKLLKEQGLSISEIANKIPTSVTTARRYLKKIDQLMAQMPSKLGKT